MALLLRQWFPFGCTTREFEMCWGRRADFAVWDRGRCSFRSREKWSARRRRVGTVSKAWLSQWCQWTQDSRNVNASIRALNPSCTLDGRRPIFTSRQEGAAALQFCPTQPRAPSATCWRMRLTQLGCRLQSGRAIRKSKLNETGA